MDAASIEEINKLRRAMGMKALPVPGASVPKEDTPENDEDAPSTLESRQAQAYDNYKKMQEAEEAKKKREERAAAVKKARDKAQRFAVLEGKGIVDDDDDLDAKSWLKSQKKRQKKIEAARKAMEEKEAAEKVAEHTAKDLAGVKVAHDMASFLDGDDQVLTLKDTGILENEDEGDELENLALREQEKLNERLDLKKKKPLYDPNDIDETGERGILSQYDEEIGGKKKKAFTLDAVGTSSDLADILAAPVQKRRNQVVDLDVLEDAPAPVSDYLDASEVKVKKPKKKKNKSTRRRADDEDTLYPGDEAVNNEADQQMDVDPGAGAFTKKRKVIDEDFVDDDDLQTSLALQRKAALKKRKKTRPEDIARRLREETANSTPEPENAEGGGGLVIDEISEFVDNLRAQQEEERKAPKPKREEALTKMDEESDEEMQDVDIKRESADRDTSPLADLPATGVEEEKVVSQGMGATLALLKERNLIEGTNGSELTEKFRQRQLFLAELHRRMALFDEDARLQRERDRASGRMDKMSTRDREEWARHQNTVREQHQAKIMEQLFREGYRPTVELKYVDADGRSLDAKEAFKELSHQFHGKGSGKGKTDKRLKKLAEEKRRMAQSMLDTSQNVDMSTAASHQGKKRKEAGVRLA
ncbi:SART-1 protein [Apodospora peruviana]|uniref:SART-1 protein n=1 Tax=Apodospora peruviana TaxID=516989 RepID=A0AAE0HYF1_9PEZI|nr:SART-1 protein [Apodospora peruviana]